MSEQRNMPESASGSDVYPIMSEPELRWAKFRRSLMRAKPAMLGGVFLILLFVVSLSAPLIATQRGSPYGHGGMLFALPGQSMPVFRLGLMYSVLDPRVRLH